MSVERQPPDDRELDAFLNGEHPVSKTYAAASPLAPPAALDAGVLQLARTAAAPRAPRRAWRTPLAAAAVLVLAVSVVLRLPERAPPPAAPAALEAPAAVAEDVMALPQVQQDAAAAESAPPAPAPSAQAPATIARKPAPPITREAEPPPPSPIANAAPSPPPEAEAKTEAAMIPAPAPVTADADAAGASAGFVERQRMAKREAMAERAERAQGSERRAYAAAPLSSLATSASAPPPVFDGLTVGEVDRAAVHARYGAPPPVTAMTDDLSPLRERYAALPGHAGAVEFLYAGDSLRLLAVVETPAAGTRVADVLAREGQTPTAISEQRSSRCTIVDRTPEVRYYWFAAPRRYWIVDRDGVLRQIVYDSGCEAP